MGNTTAQSAASHFVWTPTLYYLAIVAAFLALATSAAWPLPEMAFRSDSSPVSWLSSAQLWVMAVLALQLTQDTALPRMLAWWLCMAMAAMAFDEQFMLHEQWKYGCGDWIAACSMHWVRELPILCVGLFGTSTAIWMHRVLHSRNAKLLLWCAIGSGLFALVLDLTDLFIAMRPYEEGMEVMAEALFVGLLLGLDRQSDKSESRSPI